MNKLFFILSLFAAIVVALGMSDGGNKAYAASPNVVCGSIDPKCGDGGNSFDYYAAPREGNHAVCGYNNWHGIHIQIFNGSQTTFLWPNVGPGGWFILGDGAVHNFSLNGSYSAVFHDNRGSANWSHIWGYCSV